MNAGRKRLFDKQDALDRAMKVFWEKGYAGTSISDLTFVLGINKPSLYAAFGNKEQLFASAIAHYKEQYGGPLYRLLQEPADLALKERVRQYTLGIIGLTNGIETPKGCLFVKSWCESGVDSAPEKISEVLLEASEANEALFTDFFIAEQRTGNLASEENPAKLAVCLLAMLYGLAVLAKQNKSKDELVAVADRSLDALFGD